MLSETSHLSDSRDGQSCTHDPLPDPALVPVSKAQAAIDWVGMNGIDLPIFLAIGDLSSSYFGRSVSLNTFGSYRVQVLTRARATARSNSRRPSHSDC